MRRVLVSLRDEVLAVAALVHEDRVREARELDATPQLRDATSFISFRTVSRL